MSEDVILLREDDLAAVKGLDTEKKGNAAIGGEDVAVQGCERDGPQSVNTITSRHHSDVISQLPPPPSPLPAQQQPKTIASPSVATSPAMVTTTSPATVAITSYAQQIQALNLLLHTQQLQAMGRATSSAQVHLHV